MNQKHPQIAVTDPEIEQEMAFLTSFIPALAGIVARQHVSRKPSNSRRRKGTAQGPLGIQTPDRREVRGAILHHQPGWKGCSSVSLPGMAADRGEAGGAFELQSHE